MDGWMDGWMDRLIYEIINITPPQNNILFNCFVSIIFFVHFVVCFDSFFPFTSWCIYVFLFFTFLFYHLS